jgi:ABC-type transport system involved in multi-copper enzyme maturation permease subunit
VIWASWRLQRTETIIAAGLLALIALLLVPTGLQMSGAFHNDGLSVCLAPSNSFSCAEAIQSFTSRFDRLGSLVAWLTLVPGLVGVLLAAPFVLELENGTYRLAWTQSITRRRWIAGKLALAIGAALLVALTITLLMTWWHAPLVRIDGRMDQSVFDSEGTVVFGYTLFALGLALAAGALWRRAVPALVVAFAGYFAARIFVDTWLRQRLAPLQSVTWKPSGPDPAALNHAWVIREGPSDRLGHAIPLHPGVCRRTPSGNLGPGCLKHFPDYMHAVYEPASRFWLLQGMETTLFAGIAVVLIAFAAWWAHERTA